MARINGVDLPREKRVEIGLTYIFGIGRTRATKICAETGVDPSTRVKDLTEDEVTKIRDFIDANYTTEGDLRREVRQNVSRLMEIGCYRGLRHRKGLPVRGQRTHTNARTRKGEKRSIDIEFAKKKLEEMGPLTVKEKKAAIYFALTLLAFCTNGIHHVAPDYVVFVTIFLMLCPGIGVCSFKDVGPNFAWPAFIQLGFAMSLASCVNKTGGFQWLVDAMFTTNPAFSAMDPTLFITIWLAFVVVSHIIFAGMNAMEAVLVPVSMTMAAALGFDVYTMGLLTVMAIAPSANFLPFNSAPNLIYASTDRFSTAQQLKGAIVIAVLVIIGFVFLVNVWFPVIGIL